jgi:hypothetical protein
MAQGISYLDGPRLRRCLTAGLQRLIDQREYLNRINVFPVPDGDTGNNLAHAATAGQQSLANITSAGAGDILGALAVAVLDAAQGNSGALLAQFLQGLADSTAAQDQLSTAEFARAMTNAAAATRLALAAPREGTIISVIDASAAAAQRYADCDDFTVLLPAMLDAALVALAATTNQLEALRKAGVVDSGAAGYCAILEGCSDYLLFGSIRSTVLIPATPAIFSLHTEHAAGAIQFRYCTECLLVGPALEHITIRSALQPLGDSMVVAGSSRRLRIHIHTDDPEGIFRLAAQFGDVQGTKADDMLGQAKSLVRSNKAVAIVTDSAADLPAELIMDLDIHIIPLRVTFGSKSYLDKISMGPAEFLAELQRNPARPGTSQPTQGDLRRMYEFLLTHFTEVLSINLSSKLSGTYQAACTAAGAVAGGERVQVLDSANVSVGQGMIVKRAAELAAAGIAGTALGTAVRNEIAAMRTFALVTDLSNAVRSGRVKPVIKRIAASLHLTPVLVNTRAGKVGVHGFIPGRYRLAERFARYIARATGDKGKWEVAIASGAPGSAEAALLQAELSARLKGISTIWQTEIGPALGVHVGMTGLVVALRKLS